MNAERKFIYALLTANRSEQERFYTSQIPKGVFKVCENEISWVYRFRERHGHYPSRGAYENRFSDEPLKKHRETLSATLQPVLDMAMFVQMRDANKKAKEMLDGGHDVAKVMSFFKDSVGKLVSFSTDYVDLNFNESDAVLRGYRNLVRVKALNPNSLLRTPWPTLNKLIGFHQPGETVVIAARTSMGKAQPLTASVLTPDGFIPMGEVKRGTPVLDSLGDLQYVTQVYPQGNLEVFDVAFSDGTHVECCDNHLWSVSSHDAKKKGDYSFKVLPLREIRKRLVSSRRLLWEVPLYAGTKDESRVRLPLNPWLLGALIGDGCLVKEVMFSTVELSTLNKVSSCLPLSDEIVVQGTDFRIRRRRRIMRMPSTTVKVLRELRLLGKKSSSKFIPLIYLKAGHSDRVQLLQGLMDTDGHVHELGKCFEYYTVSPRLAFQFLSLVRSLGGYAKQTVKRPWFNYKGVKKSGQPCYVTRFQFYNGICPVSSDKHLNRVKTPTKRSRKMIVSVTPVGKKPCQCIQVSGSSSLYVTNGYTVTHNTWCVVDWADYYCDCGIKTLFITKEMTTDSIAKRFEAHRFELPYEPFRKGELAPKILARWMRERRAAKQSPYPLTISGDETVEGVGLSHIVAKVRQYKPQVVFIDGAYLIQPEGISFSSKANEKFAHISNRLKAIAKATNTLIFIVIQMNRQAEGKGGTTKGSIKDLYGSDTWAQDADYVIDVSGKRGANTRTIALLKGRESNIGEFNVKFRLHPYPDFSEARGGASALSVTSNGKIAFKGVA